MILRERQIQLSVNKYTINKASTTISPHGGGGLILNKSQILETKIPRLLGETQNRAAGHVGSVFADTL